MQFKSTETDEFYHYDFKLDGNLFKNRILY